MLVDAQVGTLKYNGWNFPPAIMAAVGAQPVLDSTGRYTKHSLYTIRVETVLYPGVDEHTPTTVFPSDLASADGYPPTHPEYKLAGMDQLRRLLLEDGKPLEFTGKGLGFDFNISTTSTPDVLYGPHVKGLIWEPIAGNCSVRIVWTVEVAIANCQLQFAGLRVLEFSTESSYALDELGLTTRTVAGQVVIANRLEQRVDAKNRTPAHWVDDLRDKVVIEIPWGFRRTSQTYNVSADGTTLSFRVTDKQLESQVAPHQGVIKHDVTHRVRSLGKYVTGQYLVSITGSFVIAPNFDKRHGWLAFLWFVKSRRDATVNALFQDRSGTQRNLAFPRTLEINDNLTNRQMSFNIAWELYTDPETLLSGAGFLEKVQESNWQNYRQSHIGTSWHPTGHSGMRSLGSSRGVVDPCALSSEGPFLVRDFSELPLAQSGTRLQISEVCEEQWKRFYHNCDLLTDTEAEPLYPTGGGKTFSKKAGREYAGTSTTPVIIHQRGDPRHIVRFHGRAEKVGGEPIKMPKLLEYAGLRDLVPIGKRDFTTIPTDKMNGCPWHKVEWSQHYQVKGVIEADRIDYKTDPDIKLP